MSCGVVRSRSSDPKLLWLWRRPVAAALIRPLAWESPYAAGATQEKAKKKKIKKIKETSFSEEELITLFFSFIEISFTYNSL